MAWTTPGTATAGEVLTAAFWNTQVRDNLLALINIKSTTVDTTVTIGAGAADTWYDFTGLAVTITPSSATSKILLLGMVYHSLTVTDLSLMQILRGSTPIGGGVTSGNRTSVHGGGMNLQQDNNRCIQYPINYLDSPNTTSATTYKVQLRTPAAKQLYGNRTANDDNATYTARPVSTITAIEVPV